jgi:hypothetical protein
MTASFDNTQNWNGLRDKAGEVNNRSTKIYISNDMTSQWLHYINLKSFCGSFVHNYKHELMWSCSLSVPLCKLTQAVTHLTSIQEVCGSNLGWDANNPYPGFHSCFSPSRNMARQCLKMMLRHPFNNLNLMMLNP